MTGASQADSNFAAAADDYIYNYQPILIMGVNVGLPQYHFCLALNQN